MNLSTFDIHDRVNYAVTRAEIEIRKEKKVIALPAHGKRK